MIILSNVTYNSNYVLIGYLLTCLKEISIYSRWELVILWYVFTYNVKRFMLNSRIYDSK